jgi:hypothetical protein
MQENSPKYVYIYNVHVMSCFLKRFIGQEAAFCRRCYWKEHHFTVSSNYPFSTRRIDSFDACKDELTIFVLHTFRHVPIFESSWNTGRVCPLFSKLPSIFGQAWQNMAGIGVVSASFNINKQYLKAHAFIWLLC